MAKRKPAKGDKSAKPIDKCAAAWAEVPTRLAKVLIRGI